MPRDSVFGTTLDDVPPNQLVLAVPADLDWRSVTRLYLDAGQVTGFSSTADVTSVGDTSQLAARRAWTTAPPVRAQLCASVYWTRDGGLVSVSVGAREATTAEQLAVPGYHVDLDWNDTNRLVKFLRNARDQAFGRPE